MMNIGLMFHLDSNKEQGSDKFILSFLHISQVTHITQFIFTSSVLGMRVDGWGERVILLAIRDCCYGLLLNL